MFPLIDMYRSGKPVKALYYCGWLARRLVPRSFRRARMRRWLRTWQARPDADYIRDRVDFYCRLKPGATLPEAAEPVHALDRSRGKRVYYIDMERWMAYFPSRLRVAFQPGDVYANPRVPTVIKAARLDDDCRENAVILPLNRVRHFPRPHDNIPFSQKEPVLFFRGKIADKPLRIRFFERWHGTPGMDLGDTSRHPLRPEWGASKVSIASHFRYRFILVLEGNDVGSALQWVMGSNCVPVMTRPFVEHWLMHSRLVPGVHYVEIAPDFSDVQEKLTWYLAHPDQAEAIAAASREWYAQFADSRRELLIALLTLHRYFTATSQMAPATRCMHGRD